MIKTIGIYCASSNLIDDVYVKETITIGTLLGLRGLHIINGAGNIGLMRIVSDAVLASGGEVTGVIPKFMVDKGLCHQNLSTIVQTTSIHARKKKISDLSDIFLALPGGYGTFEELLEIITWRQLGLHYKPIIVLNTNHFYDPLFEMLKRAVLERFVLEEHANLWHVANSPADVITIIDRLHSDDKIFHNKKCSGI